MRYQKRYWGDDLREGDVLVSNHPQLAGGSHLPDITVITPIYINKAIAFFVASRGHHADVGGIAPGSMPPLSRVCSVIYICTFTSIHLLCNFILYIICRH